MKTLRFRADTADALLPKDAAAAIDDAAIAWTKAWGRRPLMDGKSFRELLVWKGVSLWWFAELYLHHSTEATRYVRLIEAYHRILEAESPDEVEAFGLSPEEALLLARTCTARGILFQGEPARARGRGVATFLVSLESRWNTVKTLASAIKATLAGPPRLPSDAARRTVLFLSHAAFWRQRHGSGADGAQEYEHYFDKLIPGVAADARLQAFSVAVGPRAAFRRRGSSDRLRDWLRLHPEGGPYVHVNRYTTARVLRETRRATREIRAAWERLRGSPGVHEAFSHRGVAFFDLSSPDLAATLLLQLPWAVRSYQEMAEVLDAVKPALVCLYAESSGWGRAAILAARARSVATLAIQHGILYPRYYSYLHGPDEADCPRPDTTAVFGEAARRFLVERGGYDPASLVVTGSPKFDDLLAAARTWDRETIRARLGVSTDEKLVVVASRFHGIRRTHRSIGSAFPGLVRAVESLEAVQLVVKPHPAEAPDAYQAAIREAGAARARILPRGSGLLELLHAADVLVTVESLSAVEALVLGRPVVVLNMPTNLAEIVEQGMALGVREGQDPTEALRRVLFDQETRAGLGAARDRYLSDVARGVDGSATARILEVARELAL